MENKKRKKDLDQTPPGVHGDARKDLSLLELLPSIPLRMILKMIGVKELKSLRLTSKELRERISQEEEMVFHHWKIEGPRPETLTRFSSEVESVKGLILIIDYFSQDSWPSSFKELMETHPELEKIDLTLIAETSFENLQKCIPIMGPVLQRLEIPDCESSDGIFQLKQGALPCLESLRFGMPEDMDLDKCRGHLRNCDLANILNLCTPTLKDIELERCTMISHNFVADGASFPRLESVTISESNRLTELGISQLLRRSKLKVLKIDRANMTGEKFFKSDFSLFQHLNVLRFEDCKRLTNNALLSILKNCQSLTSLSLSGTSISGEEFSQLSLSFTPKLEELDLSDCYRLTEKGLFSILEKLGQTIKVLKLMYTPLTGDAFAHHEFSFSSVLETLDMSASELNGRGFLAIMTKTGSSLRNLHLRSTRVKHLADEKKTSADWFAQPVSIDLSSNKHIRCADVIMILEKGGANLRILNLNDTRISGELCHDIALTTQIKLEMLDLSCCGELTDKGLSNILNKLGLHLKELDISHTKVTEEGFAAPYVRLPSLETLDLCECGELTLQGLKNILMNHGAKLRNLTIGFHEDDISVEIFNQNCAKYCPNLVHLDCRGNRLRIRIPFKC